jgi:pilus assembly protein CpaC
VTPEVSSIDFSNAIEISGFRIPAFQTRRIQSTVHVRPKESLIISALFNEQRQKVKTGIPLLQDIPILGHLFSSTQWQHNETELLVIVTPVMFDPMRPRDVDTIRLKPDTALPARELVEPIMVMPSVVPARTPSPTAVPSTKPSDVKQSDDSTAHR